MVIINQNDLLNIYIPDSNLEIMFLQSKQDLLVTSFEKLKPTPTAKLFQEHSNGLSTWKIERNSDNTFNLKHYIDKDKILNTLQKQKIVYLVYSNSIHSNILRYIEQKISQ